MNASNILFTHVKQSVPECVKPVESCTEKSIFTGLKTTLLCEHDMRRPQACCWRTIIFRRSCQIIIQHNFLSVIER